MAGLGLEEIKKALHKAGVPSKECDFMAGILDASPHKGLWTQDALEKHLTQEFAKWRPVSRAINVQLAQYMPGSFEKGLRTLAHEGLLNSHVDALKSAGLEKSIGKIRAEMGKAADAHIGLSGIMEQLVEAETAGKDVTALTRQHEAFRGQIADASRDLEKLTKGQAGIRIDTDAVIQGIRNEAGGVKVSWATRMIANGKGIEAMRHGEPFAMSHISFGKALGWTALAALIGAGASNVLGNDATDTHRR